ncbi:MAG: transglutaminase-like domain-containing protein [Alphaproteobacteria bacterium]|nr:transglutaminase-like domain-containing protein [Alphaproteobacteria bacterium]
MKPADSENARDHGDPKVILRRIGAAPEAPFDLADGALALASVDRPGVALDHYQNHLKDLARDVAAAYEAPALEADAGAAGRCVAALNRIVLDEYGYAGDELTYDDVQNANLMRVIDRRKGLPIALGILYLHAGRAQGWSMAGLGFPGHFLVRLDLDGERIIVDPFNGGRICAADDLRGLLKAMQGQEVELRPEHYAEVTDREVLLRLQNNIKLRLLQLEKTDAAAAVADTMLLFAPDVLTLWREAGLLHAHAGNLRAAADALENYLTRETREGPRQDAALFLQRLRERLN